ncbi:MAG: ACT domain-containing protein [Ignavibacteria bacterium]|nr:ACT domain-containing protein [Ignavibacteria bacterium]
MLCSVADPLAGAGISILTIATYSTDYVLVRDADLERARTVLSMAGHLIVDD